MMDTITLKEYDSLLVKDKRDAVKKVISKDDAIILQSIILEDEPIFKWGHNKITAQQWVGTISLNNLNIEILPKLSGYVVESDLRDVLTRMLLVSHEDPFLKNTPGSVQVQKNSLVEMLIETFLNALENYVCGGLQNSYQKIDRNINRVKGRILFNKQFSRNVLKVDQFWCRYSKFTPDNQINQFFRLCLDTMAEVTTDSQNRRRIKLFTPIFEEMKHITKEQALGKTVVFNSTNQRAETAYKYGMLFLQNMYSTLNAGNVKINMMLFNMNDVYEKFIYMAARAVYRSNVNYQQRGSYAVRKDSNGKKYIALRPDLTLKRNDGSVDIVDTKWKIPANFAKESDVYQMNAYSTGIKNVENIILLYPFVGKIEMIDDYHFEDKDGRKRALKIRTIDLMKCLDWKAFLKELETILSV